MRVGHAELLGLGIHGCDKGLAAAKDIGSKLFCCIVCRIDEHDLQELAHGRHISCSIAGSLGAFLERDVRTGNRHIKIIDIVEHDHCCHDLRNRCHGHLGVGILFPEHIAVAIRDDGRLCLRECRSGPLGGADRTGDGLGPCC